MANSDTAVIILAAGKGTRLKSARAKVLHRAGGRTLIEHVVRACAPLRPRKTVVVVGHQADEVRAVVEPLGPRGSIAAVVQEPQRGTGHAVIVAQKAVGRVKYGLVLPGDAPLIRPETIAALARGHKASGAAATILSAVLDNPAGYGRIVRKSDGTVRAIVEDKAANEEERAITEINSSIYCFTLDKLWPCLSRLRSDNAHRELYLTDTIAMLTEQGERVMAYLAPDAQESLGCNSRAELAEVDRIFRARKRAELMDAGVTIYLPETVLVDPDVTIGPDTVIEPHVHLLGRTQIGANCIISTGSIISDCLLEDGVLVKPHTVMYRSKLRRDVHIGPFAHLRFDVELKRGAHLGNFVEAKKAVLDEGAKAMHLTYLGDATVGRESNVGAGTITCNYDGVGKYRTTIGRRVFVGSDTALVAPVKVGDGAYIAAGSIITDNVPPNALAIARGRQSNKPGWASKRRAELAAAKPTKKSKPRRKSPKSRKKRSRR